MIIVAVGMIALVAVSALAVDLGRVFVERRNAQNAADHAAIAGALAVCEGGDGRAVALASAASNGFVSDGADVVTVREPSARTIEVEIASVQDPGFAGGLGLSELRVTGNAIAECGAPATHAVFAGSTSCASALSVPASNASIVGGLHSNRDVSVGGSNNRTFGPFTHVGTFTNGGAGNVFEPPPVAVGTMPYPVSFDVGDYAPGGAIATQAQSTGQYYDAGNQRINNGWLESRGLVSGSSVRTLRSGLYFTRGDVDLSPGGYAGHVTFVTESGRIMLGGSNIDIRSWVPGGLLLLSDRNAACGSSAIAISGSASRWRGIASAPRGMVEMSGSDMTSPSGSLLGDEVKISGPRFRIDAPLIAGEGSVVLVE